MKQLAAVRRTVRDIETIDAELRLRAAVRRSIREHGGEPLSRHIDELLVTRRAPSAQWSGRRERGNRHVGEPARPNPRV
jgi:hypothetical protein